MYDNIGPNALGRPSEEKQEKHYESAEERRSIYFSRNQWCHAATVVYHAIRFVSHNYSVVLCHTVGLRLFDKPNCKRS